MANSSSNSQPPTGWEVQSHMNESPYYGYKHLHDQAGLSYMYSTGAGLSRSELNGIVSSSVDRGYEGEEQWSPTSVGESKKKRRAQKPRQEADKAAHLLKRRGQNRASQRAFRERKERHTKELEIKVSELVNLLESANLENSVAQSQIIQMENELSHYRHLLFASQTRTEAPTLITEFSDNPNLVSAQNYAYSGAPRPTADLDSCILLPMNSCSTSIDPPASSTTRTSTVIVKDEYMTSSTNTCNTLLDASGYSCSPEQSPSAKLGSRTSDPQSMVDSQNSMKFAADSDDVEWGMDTSNWVKGDSFSMDQQAVVYLQSTQSSTVWAGSWD